MMCNIIYKKGTSVRFNSFSIIDSLELIIQNTKIINRNKSPHIYYAVCINKGMEKCCMVNGKKEAIFLYTHTRIWILSAYKYIANEFHVRHQLVVQLNDVIEVRVYTYKIYRHGHNNITSFVCNILCVTKKARVDLFYYKE